MLFLPGLILAIRAAVGVAASTKVAGLAKKIGVVAIGVGAFVLLVQQTISGIQSLIDSIAVTVPADVVIGFSWVMPANFVQCMSAWITGWGLLFAYDVGKSLLTMKMNV